jgi:uncharacterized protein (DUF697 family)
MLMDFKWGYLFIRGVWYPGGILLGILGTEPITTSTMMMSTMLASSMMMSMESIAKYGWDVVSPI